MTMPDTPALAALREAEQMTRTAVGAAIFEATDIVRDEREWQRYKTAMDAYRDAVAARVRGECAAAMCEKCRYGEVLVHRLGHPAGNWWHNRLNAPHGMLTLCKAGSIWAALPPEGTHP